MSSLYRVMSVLALACVVATARSEEYSHQESGLKFSLPKGWSCTAKEGKLFIVNQDKTLACVGGVIPQEAAKAILADIKSFVESLDDFDDAEVTSGPEREQVNGLEQAWYEGTATTTVNGQETEIELDMTVVTGGKAVLFLVGTGELSENEDAYERFFESIKKIDSPAAEKNETAE